MIRRPPRSTLHVSSAASDVYKRQVSNRGPSAYQPTALPLGQTGSRIAQDASCPKVLGLLSSFKSDWAALRKSGHCRWSLSTRSGA